MALSFNSKIGGVANRFVLSDTSKEVTYKARFVRNITTGCCCFVHIRAINRFEVLMITKEHVGLKEIDVEYGCETNFTLGKYYLIVVKKSSAAGVYTNIRTTILKAEEATKTARNPVIPQ